jgi:predicted RNA-binding protein
VSPADIHAFPVPYFGPCNGPVACVHIEGLGHAGDHIPPTVEAEPVQARDLTGENAELRALLKVARHLLGDVKQVRGGFLRIGLLKQIDKAVGQ